MIILSFSEICLGSISEGVEVDVIVVLAVKLWGLVGVIWPKLDKMGLGMVGGVELRILGGENIFGRGKTVTKTPGGSDL